MVCSALVAVYQPTLAQDSLLLLETVTVLAEAHAFRAIERLLAATAGRTVQVNLGPTRDSDTIPGSRGATERHTISKACLRDPRLTRQWGERLLGSG